MFECRTHARKRVAHERAGGRSPIVEHSTKTDKRAAHFGVSDDDSMGLEKSCFRHPLEVRSQCLLSDPLLQVAVQLSLQSVVKAVGLSNLRNVSIYRVPDGGRPV